MKKEVYSWPVSTDVKSDLEREVRLSKTSVASLLDHGDFETYGIEGKRRFRIAPAWLGRGDQRGFSGTDASLTARSRIKLTVDKNGKVTSKEVESAPSGIGVKGFGLRGDTEGT